MRRLCVGAKSQCHYPRPVLDDFNVTSTKKSPLWTSKVGFARILIAPGRITCPNNCNVNFYYNYDYLTLFDDTDRKRARDTVGVRHILRSSHAAEPQADTKSFVALELDLMLQPQQTTRHVKSNQNQRSKEITQHH